MQIPITIVDWLLHLNFVTFSDGQAAANTRYMGAAVAMMLASLMEELTTIQG